MANSALLLARILSAGYKKMYESTEWTVFTKDGRFLAIEKSIDASARLTGAYSELVAGSYEHIGLLLADLVRMKEDHSRIAERVSRDNAILMSTALLALLGHAYYRSRTGTLASPDLKYFLIASLVILGLASSLSAIRGYQIKKEIIGIWPERIRSYNCRGSALRQLNAELLEDKGMTN